MLSQAYLEVIKALNATGTEYLLVGGWAVVAHGVDRNTADMDIWVGSAVKNLEPFRSALLSLGFEENEVETALQVFQQNGKLTLVLDEKFPVEMLSMFSSHTSFEQAFLKKDVIDFSGAQLNIVDIDTLIELKIRAGREKDFWDASKLKAQKKKP